MKVKSPKLKNCVVPPGKVGFPLGAAKLCCVIAKIDKLLTAIDLQIFDIEFIFYPFELRHNPLFEYIPYVFVDFEQKKSVHNIYEK